MKFNANKSSSVTYSWRKGRRTHCCQCLNLLIFWKSPQSTNPSAMSAAIYISWTGAMAAICCGASLSTLPGRVCPRRCIRHPCTSCCGKSTGGTCRWLMRYAGSTAAPANILTKDLSQGPWALNSTCKPGSCAGCAQAFPRSRLPRKKDRALWNVRACVWGSTKAKLLKRTP